MRQLWHDIGITAGGALAVMVSTTVMYAVFALVLRQWGDRLRAPASTATTALATLIGAIAARATLGNHPTMAGGLVALTTLLVLERIFGVLLTAARRAQAHRPHRRGRTARQRGPRDEADR